jgi:Domain of unknown function (DUF4129)
VRLRTDVAGKGTKVTEVTDLPLSWSHPAGRRHLAACALAIVIALLPAVASGQPDDAGGRPTHAEITRALEQVKTDPNLATERTIHTLRWKESTKKSSGTPEWLSWITGLFGWIAQGSRVVAWTAVAVLAAMLVFFVARLVHARGLGLGSTTIGLMAPTHVHDLDIRPESLPADVGAAARALWSRGHHRAALALLYRGLLSRLAHVHRVPIRDSSTEGDCLALAGTHLTLERSEYTSRLIRVWQRAVYGGEDADTAVVYALCDGFALALDPAPDAATSPERAAEQTA